MDFSRPPEGDGNRQDQIGGIDAGAAGRAEIEAAIERILASRLLSSSPRQQALLRHITTETLEGRGDRLKEFSLAVDVFGRPPSFDPRVDSIVRVQASRLRALLAEYYAKDGASETLRVEIPAGGYVATFSPATHQARPPVQKSPPKDDTMGEPPMRKAYESPPDAGKPWLFPVMLGLASLALLLLVVAVGTLGGQRTADDHVRPVRRGGRPSS